MWYKVYSVVRLVELGICGRFNHSVCWNRFLLWWLWPPCFAVALAANSHSFSRFLWFPALSLRRVCTLNIVEHFIVIPSTLCCECKFVLICVVCSDILWQRSIKSDWEVKSLFSKFFTAVSLQSNLWALERSPDIAETDEREKLYFLVFSNFAPVVAGALILLRIAQQQHQRHIGRVLPNVLKPVQDTERRLWTKWKHIKRRRKKKKRRHEISVIFLNVCLASWEHCGLLEGVMSSQESLMIHVSALCSTYRTAASPDHCVDLSCLRHCCYLQFQGLCYSVRIT